MPRVNSLSGPSASLPMLAPKALVPFVSLPNPFGHPSPEVLARLREVLPQHQLYDTSRDGTVELTTDGSRWWVQTHP